MSAPAKSIPRSPILRKTLASVIYSQLHEDISTGVLPPGERLVIDRLARNLAVSITPVREAISRLQKEGLVTEKPFSGLQVAALSTDELYQRFEVRGVLEGYAAKLALPFLNSDALQSIRENLNLMDADIAMSDPVQFRVHNRHFHKSILLPVERHPISEQIGTLATQTDRYLSLGVSLLSEIYMKTVQGEHRLIFEALLNADSDKLEQLLRRHALTFVTHFAEKFNHVQTST